MGTKKGGARKGKPKGSRLAFDDTPKSKKSPAGKKGWEPKAPKKSWGEARAEAKRLKKFKRTTSSKGINTDKKIARREWGMMVHSLITTGYTPEQAMDIILRLFKK